MLSWLWKLAVGRSPWAAHRWPLAMAARRGCWPQVVAVAVPAAKAAGVAFFGGGH